MQAAAEASKKAEGDREMGHAAGCIGFLTKPLRQGVLLQAIRALSVIAVLASGV
jgi:CheY-like chemotaxis protein